MMMRFVLQVLVVTFLLASCAGNAYYDSSKPHHTESGFRNIEYQDEKSLARFLKWRWQKLFKDIPGADAYAFVIDDQHHALLKENRQQTSLTWIGHATFLLQFEGLNILTDPQFSPRASPLSWIGPKRVVAPGIEVEELPEIDLVVISHDHYDSLDVTTIRQLAAHNRGHPITFVVPLGIKPWLEALGLKNLRAVELDWGQDYFFNGIRLIAEPAQHWSKRSLFDNDERLWASWVIESPAARIYFAGDTGYARHFSELGNKYGEFDLALLPIGAYEPRWFMKGHHVNPEEAVRIHRDIRSKYSVAMHWGTFILTDEPLDEPPVKLLEALNKLGVPESEFEVYRHGETRFLQLGKN